LCAEDEHTVIAIGPTFKNWTKLDEEAYARLKESEQVRLMGVLEKRFPGIKYATRRVELATPRTIERYNMKNGGAVAGPKQMLGQHMFKRLHTRTEWDNFFCCGESTVMGTGTPTVTTSGISAANAVLKKKGLEPFVYQKGMKNYIRVVDKPFTSEMLFGGYPEKEKALMREASRCCLCERPACTQSSETDIRGMMRRVVVGNFKGAKKVYDKHPASDAELEVFEGRCIRGALGDGQAVKIQAVVSGLREVFS